MKLKKKIILGTAQFGNKYGIFTNQTKTKNLKEIKRILRYSFLNNINYLDTAFDYKNSEKIIGKLSKSKFKIISKIKVHKNLSLDSLEKYFIKKVLNSLSRLKSSYIYILHLHNVDDHLDNKKYLSSIFKILNKLKKKNIIKKIGVSTYYPDKIHRIYKYFKFDVAQVPFNIFDQRLLRSKIYNSHIFKKVEIHVRSIFLQGITLTESSPKYFFRWKKKIDLYFDFLKKKNIEPIYFSMAFVKNLKNINGIIFGIQNLNQLKEIIKFEKKFLKINYKECRKFKIEDKNFLIPYNWKIVN
jgi:aryl-alcohol dehydrogenase-like predicted oxidoreductase